MCVVSMLGELTLNPVSREDGPAAYDACDGHPVSQDRLRAQVKCEDESQVRACDRLACLPVALCN